MQINADQCLRTPLAQQQLRSDWSNRILLLPSIHCGSDLQRPVRRLVCHVLGSCDVCSNWVHIFPAGRVTTHHVFCCWTSSRKSHPEKKTMAGARRVPLRGFPVTFSVATALISMAVFADHHVAYAQVRAAFHRPSPQYALRWPSLARGLAKSQAHESNSCGVETCCSLR